MIGESFSFSEGHLCIPRDHREYVFFPFARYVEKKEEEEERLIPHHPSTIRRIHLGIVGESNGYLFLKKKHIVFS